MKSNLKRIISIIIPAALMFVSMGAGAYNIYENTQTSTLYTPWFSMYHMQTAEDAANGIRGGEGGQVIMSMGISQVNPDIMLFGSDTAGLWRSTDGGENWYAVSGINMWAVNDIAFHPSQADTVYIIQGMSDFTENSINKLKSSSKDGLYKSIDGGKTFTHVLHKQILASNGSEGLIQFDKENNVYVLTNEGVYKSADGAEWTSLGSVCDADTGIYSMAVSGDGQTIFCATVQNGLVGTFDGGTTWNSLTQDVLSGVVRSVVFNPTDESLIYVTCESGDNKGVLEGEIADGAISFTQLANPTAGQSKNIPTFLKFGAVREDGSANLYHISDIMAYPFRASTDYGRTWSGFALNKEDVFTHQITGYQSEGMCVHPTDPDILYYSFSDVIFKSTDGGKSFNYSCSGYSGNYSRHFKIDSMGRVWFPFMDKGIGRTDGAYNKDNPPTGKMLLTGGTASDIAFDPNDEKHIIAGLGDWTTHTLKESCDGGVTWSDITSAGEGSYGYICWHENGETIYASSKISYDGGETWVTPEVGVASVSPVNNDVVYGSKDKVIYRSDDCGKTWTQLTSTSAPYFIRADRFDEKTVWVGCYDSTIIKIAGTTRTVFDTDNGLPVTYKIAFDAFAQNPNDKNHLLAGGKDTFHGETSPGLFESRDGGKTWVNVPDMPSGGMIFAIEFMPDGKSALLGTYAGTIIYDHEVFLRYSESSIAAYIGETARRTAVGAKEIYAYINTDGSAKLTVNGGTTNTYNLNSNTTTGEKASLYFEFDLPTSFNKESAILTIDTGKINAGGSFSIYAVSDSEWGKFFSPLRDGSYSRTAEEIPKDGVLIAKSGHYDYNTSGSHSELDITEYVKEISESGSRKVRLHVVYNTQSARTPDGARVCGINYADSTKRIHIDEVYSKKVTSLSGSDMVIKLLPKDSEKRFSVAGVFKEDAFQSASLAEIEGETVHKIPAEKLTGENIKHFLFDKYLVPQQSVNQLQVSK